MTENKACKNIKYFRMGIGCLEINNNDILRVYNLIYHTCDIQKKLEKNINYIITHTYKYGYSGNILNNDGLFLYNDIYIIKEWGFIKSNIYYVKYNKEYILYTAYKEIIYGMLFKGLVVDMSYLFTNETFNKSIIQNIMDYIYVNLLKDINIKAYLKYIFAVVNKIRSVCFNTYEEKTIYVRHLLFLEFKNASANVNSKEHMNICNLATMIADNKHKTEISNYCIKHLFGNYTYLATIYKSYIVVSAKNMVVFSHIVKYLSNFIKKEYIYNRIKDKVKLYYNFINNKLIYKYMFIYCKINLLKNYVIIADNLPKKLQNVDEKDYIYDGVENENKLMIIYNNSHYNYTNSYEAFEKNHEFARCGVCNIYYAILDKKYCNHRICNCCYVKYINIYLDRYMGCKNNLGKLAAFDNLCCIGDGQNKCDTKIVIKSYYMNEIKFYIIPSIYRYVKNIIYNSPVGKDYNAIIKICGFININCREIYDDAVKLNNYFQLMGLYNMEMEKFYKLMDKITSTYVKEIEGCIKCPNCNIQFEKNGGCNTMMCYNCGIVFCVKCSSLIGCKTTPYNIKICNCGYSTMAYLHENDNIKFKTTNTYLDDYVKL